MTIYLSNDNYIIGKLIIGQPDSTWDFENTIWLVGQSAELRTSRKLYISKSSDPDRPRLIFRWHPPPRRRGRGCPAAAGLGVLPSVNWNYRETKNPIHVQVVTSIGYSNLRYLFVREFVIFESGRKPHVILFLIWAVAPYLLTKTAGNTPCTPS